MKAMSFMSEIWVADTRHAAAVAAEQEAAHYRIILIAICACVIGKISLTRLLGHKDFATILTETLKEQSSSSTALTIKIDISRLQFAEIVGHVGLLENERACWVGQTPENPRMS